MPSPNEQPHVAIVCDTVPYPARSGDNQRIAELIHVLREKGWFVHLLVTALMDKKLRNLCRSHVDALHVYNGRGMKTRTRNAIRRAVRFIDRIGKRAGIPPAEELASRWLGRALTPLVMDYWQRYPQGLDCVVARLSARYPWKALIVEYIWLYPAARSLHNGVARLLDTHDIQHKRVEEFTSRGMQFPLRITREEEADIFNQFDAVIAIQAAEAEVIKTMCPGLRVLTVGSRGCGGQPGSAAPVDGRLLYVGGYNGANIDGLRRFLLSIWPHIHLRYPHAHLHVCGYIYRAFLGEQFENVRFLGHRDSVENEYAEAAVVINPAWIGTGLKIKTIEALARGKALVTTSKGIEGLPEGIEGSVLVADDDETFAQHLLRLLVDPEARHRLSEAASTFSDAHLNECAVYQELFDFLNQLK